MRRLIPCLLVACLLGSANLHLVGLQLVAWAGMLVRYSQDRSLGEAAEMTFDGDHPCPLCCAIKKAKAKPAHTFSAPEQRDANVLFLERDAPGDRDVRFARSDGTSCAAAMIRAEQPPVPPPRAAA
jgi:hypothetical protein